MNMKKYILSVLALVAICLSATAQTLTPVWKTTAIPVGSVWGGDARQGVGINGVFYINNGATESVEAYNQDGFISSTPTGYGWSITSDDAGNIISRAGTPGAGASLKTDSIQINIIPAAGGSVIKVSLAGLQNFPEARCDYFGHVYGDVVNGTGYLILSMNGESKLYAVAFDHGQVDPSKSFQLNCTKELMGFATQSTLSFSYVDKSGAQHATLMVRNGGKLQDLTLDMNNGVLGSNILDVKDVPVNRGADAGGEIFMLGDSLYAVYPLKDPTGSFNYLDGFQIANITSQEEGPVVVATVANTYQAEQNKGAGNWITVEHVNDTLVNLYNYYLNGFVAMYTFSIPGKPGVPNNALQLNFKDATDSVVVMLKDEPSYEFSTDGTQMTVYKGTTALGAAHSVSNLASLFYTYAESHKHTLTMVQDTVFPTDETTGTLAYWECTGTEEDPGCHLYFADSLGTQKIGNADSLATWLAEGGKGYLKCLYNDADRYVIVATKDTVLIINTKYLAEISNVTDTINSLQLIYRAGTTSVHAGETIAIPETELKSVDLKKGSSLGQTTGNAMRTGEISVKWIQLWENGPKFAEYNVGAENNKAEDYGGYYAWGGNQNMVDDHNTGSDPLTGNDDTATNLWGENWRMPTEAELQALLDNCDVEWTTVNGVQGSKFTGKGYYSTNSIFLSAAASCQDGSVQNQGNYGTCWSSTPNGNYAISLSFGTRNFVSNDFRQIGYSVRAVLVEE